MNDLDLLAAVVVVNYGSHRLLRSQWTGLTVPDGDGTVAVIVVDNFSTEDERTAISELCRQRTWHLVLLDENRGFGGGMNAGVARARTLGADTVVLVNPDASISDEALLRLVRAARDAPGTIWAPTISRSDGRIAFAGGSLDLNRGTLTFRGFPAVPEDGAAKHRWEPWLSGACLAMSLTLWERVGGFDDDYFMYWEDVDLTVRAHRLGAQLRVLDTDIVHDPGGTQVTTTGSAKSPLYVRYNCRNRLVFAVKLLEPTRRRRWVLESPSFARAVALRSGRRALLRSPSLIAAAVIGTLQGVGYLVRHRRYRAS